jgi:hypothetical protein
MNGVVSLGLGFSGVERAEQVGAFWSGVGAALSVGHTWFSRPWLAVEVVAEAGRLEHFVTAPAAVVPVVSQQLSAQLPSVRWEHRQPPALVASAAVELRLSSRGRPLRTDRAAEVCAAVLMAMAAVRDQERLYLQVILAGAPAARAVHNPSGGRTAQDLSERLDLEHRRGDRAREARGKGREPLLFGAWRLGATSTQAPLLIRGVLGALRGSDGPGVRTLVRTVPSGLVRARLQRRTVPQHFPSVYNGAELAARVPFPIEGPQVPGLTLGGSRLLVPARAIAADPKEGPVLATATFPGSERPLVLRDVDRLEHLYVNGPTGVGKSTLLARIAAQDIAHGHAVIVIEPRGDLVDDVLDRLPPERVKDVVLLDPADEARPVGYNPLAAVGRSLDLISDSITSVFSGLFAQYWGPRTDDVLRSCLMTLGLATRPPGETFTLCEVPALLTDEGFRAPLTAGLDDPVALEPFWAIYNGLRPNERAQVISPLLNKLRAFLLRRSLRAMLGQSEPKWSIEQVMAKRQILLVPLRAGLIGEEAAQLFGSLVVARIWQATLGRAALPRAERPPVMVLIDEFHTLVHSEQSLGDLLAQARGHGVALTLAHQHLGQLSPEMRRDILANARSKVLYQQGIEDARVLARGLRGLTPEDLQGLPSREVVCSLVTNAEVQPAVTGRTLPLGPALGSAAAARAHSRQSFGVDRAEVEAALARRRGGSDGKAARPPRQPKARKRRPVIGEVPEGGEA